MSITNNKLKDYINSGKYKIYQHTNGTIDKNFYIISIGEINKSYLFKYRDNSKNNPELIYECDYSDDITNKFWYELGENGSLVPGKFFNYTDNELINLQSLNKAGEYLDDTIKIEPDITYNLACSLEPNNAETVGKIEWVLSDELKDKLSIKISRDTFECDICFNNDREYISQSVTGTITAIPYDNSHNEKLVLDNIYPSWTIEYNDNEVEDKVEIQYIEVKTTPPETNSWMNEVGLVTTVTEGAVITLSARPFPIDAETLVHEYKWFIANSAAELNYEFKGGGENGNIGQSVQLQCNYLPTGTYFFVEAYDKDGNYILSSKDFAIETKAVEVVPPVEPEISGGETTKAFKKIEKVSPLDEIIKIYNDNSGDTLDDEITMQVKIYPEDTTDTVEIKWSVSGDVTLSTDSGLSCTTKGFVGDVETHYVYATPVVNGIEQTDKRIEWAFKYYNTCIYCNHIDLAYNFRKKDLPTCPSPDCGKQQ